MSTLYERAESREAKIWRRFQHNGVFSENVNDARDTVFGLYMYQYKHGIGYLLDLETEQLAWLLAEYNDRMGKITAERAALSNRIAAEILLEEYKQQAFRDNLATMDSERNLRTQILDAQIAAAESDRDVLITLNNKISIAKSKAQNEINLIKAKIKLESAYQSQVEIEILEKTLQVSRKELRNIEINLEVVEIQQRVLEVAIEIAQYSVRVAQTEADIAKLEAEITKVGTWGKDLEELKVVEANLALKEIQEPAQREKLIIEQINTKKEQLRGLAAEYSAHVKLNSSQLNEIIAQETARIAELQQKIVLSDDKTSTLIDTFETDEQIATRSTSVDADIHIKSKEFDAKKKWESGLDYNWAIMENNLLRAAQVTNTLVHSVSKGG